MLASVVSADAKFHLHRTRASLPSSVWDRKPRRISAPPAFRLVSSLTTRPSLPNGSWPSATCTISGSTRRSVYFASVQKLQELFKAGTVRLSAALAHSHSYQFDRRDVLRYTKRDRLGWYKRVFGYGDAQVPTGSRANTDFHKLFCSLRAPGNFILARQADFRRHSRARLRSQLRIDRHRASRRDWIFATT